MGRPSRHATHPPPATRGSHPVLPGGRFRRARRPVHAVLRPRFRHVWLGRLRRARLQPLRRRFAAGCPDVTTLRIMARAGGAQAIWSQGRWEWTAPPGTTIVGGALAYRTRMRHSNFFARVKMRSGGDWADAPTLLAEQQTIGLTDHVIALASGFRQVGISLYAHPAAAGLITDAWDDYVTLVHLDVTVADATTPGVAWVDGENLIDGLWHRDDVCAHRRRRRQRVGSRERLACQRRDLDRLVRSAHRLAVSAGAALGSGAALPVCSGARRRHPPWRRRRRRCERRGRGRHSVHGLDRPHAARGRRDRARLGHRRHATSHRARLLRCRERHRLDRHPGRRRCAPGLTAWSGPRHRAAGSGFVLRSPHAVVERNRRCRQSHRREHELRGARHDSAHIRQAGAAKPARRWATAMC